MPSWDRPSGGGDRGGDRPRDVFPGGWGTGGREGAAPAAEGTDPAHNGADRSRHPVDKGREGHDAAEGREGTGKKTDRDDRDTEIERQNEVIEKQEGHIGRLVSGLGERDAKIDRLKEENDLQADTIERLEAELEALKGKEGVTGPKEGLREKETLDGSPDGDTDHATDKAPDSATDKNAERVKQLETEVAESHAERRDLVGIISGQTKTIGRLESEVESLKAKLADAPAGKKDRDHPAEGDGQAIEEHPEEQRRADASTQADAATAESRLKRMMRLPSEKATGAFTGIVAAADTIAVVSHGLTGSEAGVIGAVTTAAVGVYLWIKSGHDERRERKRNADQRQD